MPLRELRRLTLGMAVMGTVLVSFGPGRAAEAPVLIPPEESATYEAVGRGDTGHAESVRITYDPSRVSFGELLHVYLLRGS